MTSPGLPVNLDTTYADDGADPSVKLHQQITDVTNAFVNEHATAASAPRADGDVWVRRSGIFIPDALTSSDVRYTTFVQVTGTTLAITAAHLGCMVHTSSGDAAATTWTLPLQATVDIPVGGGFGGLQWGTGQISVVGEAGVTIRAEGGANKSRAQYVAFYCTKIFTNTFWLENVTT